MICGASDDRFPAFDIVLKQRGRGRWKWSVRTTDGHALMSGSECSRGGARYKAERALFLLLCASASRAVTVPLEEVARRTPHQCKNTGASEHQDHRMAPAPLLSIKKAFRRSLPRALRLGMAW